MTREEWIRLYLTAYEKAGGERSEEAATEYAEDHIDRVGLDADPIRLAEGDVEFDAI